MDQLRDLMKIEVSSNISEVKPKVIQTGLLAYGFSITKDNKKFCYTKYNIFQIYGFLIMMKEKNFSILKN